MNPFIAASDSFLKQYLTSLPPPKPNAFIAASDDFLKQSLASLPPSKPNAFIAASDDFLKQIFNVKPSASNTIIVPTIKTNSVIKNDPEKTNKLINNNLSIIGFIKENAIIIITVIFFICILCCIMIMILFFLKK